MVTLYVMLLQCNYTNKCEMLIIYIYIYYRVKVKGLVHFKMKITPSFTHPQAILGVYDFLLSNEHNQSYINKYPDASKFYNGSEQDEQV